MKRLIVAVFAALLIASCGSNENKTATTDEKLPPGVHKGVAIETMNATKYTYLLVNENGAEKWLACPLTNVKVGDTYYYGNEMVMTNFISKDLGRTFETISFIDALHSQPPVMNENMPQDGNPQAQGAPDAASQPQHTGTAGIQVQKKDVHIEADKGVVRIGDLLANMKKYEGKKVKVKGLIEKYNAGIMDRNWIHIQDGTESNGRYDLVVSTTDNAVVGEILALEGTVVLNKDFGAGYVYDILIEDAHRK